MTEIQLRRPGAWLIAAGALLIGIGSAEAQVERLLSARLPPYWASALAILGILCVVAGVLLWLLSRISAPLVWKDYECHKARKKDLDLIYNFAKQQLGEDVSPVEVMKSWYGKNPSVFFVIITEKRTSFEVSKRMVGYFCAIPLTESALGKIESGEIKARDLPNEYIARIRRDCRAVYIGGIAAKGLGAKAALLAVLHKEFTSGKRKWARTFYTRPVTKDGVRIAIKKGFTAIDPLNHGKVGAIYKLEL
jgi:hypothetical protein